MRRDRQRGVGLIDALAALLVFAVGLLGLALLYTRAAPAPIQNAQAASAQLAADSFLATVAASPSVLPLTLSNVTASSGMPASLQGWFTQSAQSMPLLTVSVVSSADASGNACSSQSCALTLTLQWGPTSAGHIQVFHGQIGFH